MDHLFDTSDLHCPGEPSNQSGSVARGADSTQIADSEV